MPHPVTAHPLRFPAGSRSSKLDVRGVGPVQIGINQLLERGVTRSKDD